MGGDEGAAGDELAVGPVRLVEDGEALGQGEEGEEDHVAVGRDDEVGVLRERGEAGREGPVHALAHVLDDLDLALAGDVAAGEEEVDLGEGTGGVGLLGDPEQDAVAQLLLEERAGGELEGAEHGGRLSFELSLLLFCERRGARRWGGGGSGSRIRI